MIAFRPGCWSPKALDFIANSTAKLCIAHGSVRSGKTVCRTVRWLRCVAEGPPGALAMPGKDRNALQRNVLDDLMDLAGPADCRWASRVAGELELFGRRAWAIGASSEEAERKLRGATFAGAYCDEASAYPEGVWLQLMARLSVRGAQVFANCNPETPAHWFHRGGP